MGATLTFISNKWKALRLRGLMPGTKRFGELNNSIGHVPQKVLTAQLREMEATRFDSEGVCGSSAPCGMHID